jgi:hypothetical protein
MSGMDATTDRELLYLDRHTVAHLLPTTAELLDELARTYVAMAGDRSRTRPRSACTPGPTRSCTPCPPTSPTRTSPP